MFQLILLKWSKWERKAWTKAAKLNVFIHHEHRTDSYSSLLINWKIFSEISFLRLPLAKQHQLFRLYLATSKTSHTVFYLPLSCIRISRVFFLQTSVIVTKGKRQFNDRFWLYDSTNILNFEPLGTKDEVFLHRPYVRSNHWNNVLIQGTQTLKNICNWVWLLTRPV